MKERAQDIEMLRAFVEAAEEIPPQHVDAALHWLNERIRHDRREGIATAFAVGLFLQRYAADRRGDAEALNSLFWKARYQV